MPAARADLTPIYRTDVSVLPVLTQTFASVVKDFGQIDGCITAAGVVLSKSFIEHEWDETLRIELVNVRFQRSSR